MQTRCPAAFDKNNGHIAFTPIFEKCNISFVPKNKNLSFAPFSR
jgi:hypothetical protein